MIVVTGASGNVGGALVRRLAGAGAGVTAVSRTSPVPGVRHVAADLYAPDTLKPAVDGADALFLLVPGAGVGLDVDRLLAVARSGGVSRVVLLSSQAAGTRPDSPAYDGFRALEAGVARSGLAWTVLRSSGLASNAFGWAPGVRGERTVAAPSGDVGLPVIDPADIAAVAAVVLRDGGHGGRTYELTGPVAVTPRGQAAALAAALGEPVRFVELGAAEARARMLSVMPEPVVDGTLAILGSPTAAEQRVSPHVAEVLGRGAGAFDAWARRNVAAFRAGSS